MSDRTDVFVSFYLTGEAISNAQQSSFSLRQLSNHAISPTSDSECGSFYHDSLSKHRCRTGDRSTSGHNAATEGLRTINLHMASYPPISRCHEACAPQSIFHIRLLR
jgi:hypothetical protein